MKNLLHRRRGVRLLLSSAAVAPLLVFGLGTSAQAQSADTQKMQAQLDALVAQVSALKKEMRAQAKDVQRTRVKIKEVQAQASGPIVKGPYTPPQPWDKKFHLGPVNITPGGFLEGAGVWRQHAQQADIASQFGALPFPNNPLYGMAESRFSARQSRMSVLADAEVAPNTVASAFAEFDFLGAAHTANGVESNSYNPRIRHLYAALDWNDPGFHVLAGQTWTMLNLDGKGIVPRSEVFAPFIDADFIPGQLWERGAQVRVVKDFNKTFWLGLSLENPQTTFAACPSVPTGGQLYTSPTTGFGQLPSGVDVYCQSPGGQFYDSLTNYSFNRIPDIVGKAAWDGKLGENNVHLEAMGLYTELYDQVASGGTVSGTTGLVSGYTPEGNRETSGYGVGGGVVAQIIPKWVDTEAQVFAGRGIGRYGTSLLPDATFNSNGTLSPIPEVMFLGSVTLHATPTIDLWAGGGFEREFGDYFQYSPTGYYGVGIPTVNNSGCYIEGGTCSGLTKEVWQLTGGVWDKIYNGAFGSVRVGMQYSYTQRELFPGTGGGSAAFVGTPKTSDNMILTSLRYYPFQ